jgi:hypothetical protein
MLDAGNMKKDGGGLTYGNDSSFVLPHGLHQIKFFKNNVGGEIGHFASFEFEFGEEKIIENVGNLEEEYIEARLEFNLIEGRERHCNAGNDW